MEATRNRVIQDGKAYDALFPKAKNSTSTIRRNADVNDTVQFIPKVVQQTLDQTRAVAHLLKKNNTYETCKNIWHFVYGHIRYRKDQAGYEQIRSPARTWHDRFKGVDCDCYSVFISSILTNLGIPHVLRITKYHREYFQHIYPIVPQGSGHITMDCVTDQFNYEVPYSEKKDYPMDLQYLNGFDGYGALYHDPNDLYLMGAGDGMAELGKIIQSKMNIKKPKPAVLRPAKPAPVKKPFSPVKKPPVPALAKSKLIASRPKPAAPPLKASLPAIAPGGQKPKKVSGKILNVVNKANPATVLLRNGILASMKLNTRKVAARLRWSYLTPQQAAAKGIDPAKFQKLIAVRMKLEKIFYGAGGNANNLKKAILEGKGNKDKAVHGLGMLDLSGLYSLSESSSLQELLGVDLYYDEQASGLGEAGALGEPITLATLTAAAGVIAGIVAMLKDVGDIFKKKTEGSQDFDETKNPDDSASPDPGTNTPTVTEQNPVINTTAPVQRTTTSQPEVYTPAATENTVPEPGTSNAELPSTVPAATLPEPNTTGASEAVTAESSFWEKNKKWLKPVAIGVGGLTLVGIGVTLFKGKPAQNKSSPKGSLAGVPHKKKNHQRRKAKPNQKKRAVVLL